VPSLSQSDQTLLCLSPALILSHLEEAPCH
jgi:hypothetical protein